MGDDISGDRCPFYRLLEKQNSRRADKPIRIPYCEHPRHSPFGKGMVERGVGGGQLQCGGSLRACPLAIVWSDGLDGCD